MEYFLKQVAPGNPLPLLISLHEDEMKIGRSTVTSLGRYNRVSRNHASFTRRNGSWYITDLKSLNCLYVNLERVHDTVQVNIGDIIGFGSPNVSEDGGFVCVLAARSKITVKQEPLDDDDDCVEIPINNVEECTSRQEILKKANDHQVDSTPKNFPCKSLDVKIVTSESTIDAPQKMISEPEGKAFVEQPIIELLKLVKKDNVNSFAEMNIGSTLDIDHGNPVLQTKAASLKVEYDNKKSNEVYTDHNNGSNCRPISDSESSLSPTYPGIKYFAELGEDKYCSNIVRDAIAKDTVLENNSSDLSYSVMDPKEKFCFNSTDVKQERLDDVETNSIAKNQQKSVAQKVIKLEKCEKISDGIVNQPIKIEGISKDISVSTFNEASTENDRKKENFKTNSDCISVSSQNLNNAFYNNKNSMCIDKVVGSYDSFHLSQNFEKINKHYEAHSVGVTEKSEAFPVHENKLYMDKQKCNKFNINSEGYVAKPTKENSSSNLMCEKSSTSEGTFSKLSLNSNMGSVKCDLENTEMPANTKKNNCLEKLVSKRRQQDEKFSDIQSVNNRKKESSKIKNKASKTERNDLTVAINLTVQKNKTLNSESDYERKNEPLPSPPPHFVVTDSRRPKRKSKTHHKDECDSQRSKSRKIKESVDKVSHSGHFKRRNSWSYDSDDNDRTNEDKSKEIFRNNMSKSLIRINFSGESHRTKPSEKEKLKEITLSTKSKYVGRTLLIQSKPMEYRPRTLRGREEWFQERTGDSNVKNCSQNLKRRSSFTESKTYEKVDTEAKNSKKLKLKECCKKRKEKDKLKNRGKESEYMLQRSETVHSRDKTIKYQKIRDRESEKSKKLDVCKKKVKPPVPRRKTESCSRMGFLLDAPINCNNKSINKHAQENYQKKKQEQAKVTENIASEGKIHLDLSVKVDILKEKSPRSRQRSYKSSVVQHNYTKTLTQCDTNDHASTQYSNPFTKNNPENPVNTVHESEKWIPITETNSKRRYIDQSKTCVEKCNPDEHLISNTFTEAEKGYPSKDISNSNNSEIAAIFSPSQYSEGSAEFRHSTRILEKLQVSSTLLMEMIVNWNPKWLIEQLNNENPPPLITKGASLLNVSFSSYESYAASYFPMIILETWESIFKECNQDLLLNKLQNCTNFCYVVKTWENKRELTELKCETVVSDVLCYWPIEGNILLLNLKDRHESRIEHFRFGCIRRHSVETFKRGPSEWDYIPVEALDNAKLVKFEVLIKKSKKLVSCQSVRLAYGLSNIKPYLQLADSLRFLQNSPLCQNIYHPCEDTLKFCNSSSLGTYSFSNDNLIQAISEEVKNSNSKAKVLMLHAPSGTGKSRCVVELVKELIFKNSTKCKVLVCTPYYTVLDELLQELIRSNYQGSNLPSTNSMKLVRIGEREAMDTNLMEYSLTRKVENLYRDDCAKKMHAREHALKVLERKINDILFKQESRQDMYSKINKSTTLKALIDQMNATKSKNLLHHMDDGCRKGYECLILQESDVLFTVLECTMLPAIRTFLKTNSTVYCIVDEAAQCNELQLLHCLHEKIKKLILFGDVQLQKPAVLSKYAAQCGFDRSIFERFSLHYRKKFKKTVCPVFKQQYRMHSEICQFPSKYFYNQELSTERGVDERYSNFPLKPYIVLDVLDSGPVPTDTESSLIMYICSVLVQTCPAATIGVIVSAEENKPSISLPWDPEYRLVELNNLEGFHGKEKDIILIPCIRKPTTLHDESFIADGKMLNTAITRAKQCLIICGQIASKVEYSHWRNLMDDAVSRNCYLCVASLAHLPMVFANYIKKV
ncbi:hypothetical protein JTE90_028532 [Oedothorax gibbosus]|uniref:FHA domain-containing protein n=1 Tax=Oedothorax gibbosus TaxID=931172 RepID=A0AAV6VUW0_9ARAC|nr:hypothetical protein JTE90_028532 [Oedothorax gibbosus]